MLVRYLRQFLLLIALGGSFSQIELAQSSIPNGMEVSGQLSAQAANQWTFSANSGDFAAVAIAVTGAPAGANACFQIKKPDGSLQSCYYGNYAAQLSESGTYTIIVVRGDGGQHGGTVSYVLNLAQAPESYEGSEDGGVMANGQEYNASLTPGDLDQWSIFLQPNDYLFLVLGAIGSGPNGTGSSFAIISPAGTQIGVGAYSSINFRATTGGEYRVIVYRNDGLTSSAGLTADYRLTAAIAPQSFVPTSGGGSLSSGGLDSGMLSQGDLNQWSFDAAFGQPITVNLTAAAGNPPGVGSSFSIVQPDGSLLFYGTAQNSSFTARQTGSYRVIVYRNDGLNAVYYQTALYNIALTGGIVAAPTVTLLDPVPSLLAGIAVTTDTNRLAQGGLPVTGIAADGTAQIVLRITATGSGQQFTVSLTGDGFLGAVGSEPSGSGNIRVTSDRTNYAFALYRAPVDFVRPENSGDGNLDHREVILTVTSLASNASTTVPVTIWRPPIVLVHGLWSKPEAWDHFTPLVVQNASGDTTSRYDSRFSVYRADYRLLASNHVSEIETTVARELEEDLDEFKETRDAAAAQFDVVAHSLGGLVAKDLALDPQAILVGFGNGFIHKLITIGTPHDGTPIADVLLHSSSFCKAALAATGHVVDGAVEDLEPDSLLLRSLLAAVGSARSHAIAGVADLMQEIASLSALAAVSWAGSYVVDVNVCVGLAPLNSGQSDLLVPVASQTAGFPAEAVDLFPDTIHSVAPLFPEGPDELNRVSLFGSGSSEIPSKVIDLLNRNSSLTGYF